MSYQNPISAMIAAAFRTKGTPEHTQKGPTRAAEARAVLNALVRVGPNLRPDLVKHVLVAAEIAALEASLMCVGTRIYVDQPEEGEPPVYIVVADPVGLLLVHADGYFEGAETPASIVALPVADEVEAYTNEQAVAAVATALDGGSESIGVTYDPADSTNPLFVFLRNLSVRLSHLSSEVVARLLSLDQKASFPAGASATNPLALKSDIPAAQTSTGNLYEAPGQNTDGPMSQKATTNALATKADQVLVLQATVALIAGQAVRLAYGTTDLAAAYDAEDAAQYGLFVGIVLAPAAAGEPVRVQATGLVGIVGWNLIAGKLYRVGVDGALLVTSSASEAGLAFSHTVGRAQTEESLQLNTNQLFFF